MTRFALLGAFFIALESVRAAFFDFFAIRLPRARIDIDEDRFAGARLAFDLVLVELRFKRLREAVLVDFFVVFLVAFFLAIPAPCG